MLLFGCMICTNCHYRGEPKTLVPGSMGVELVLWLLFLFPGIIYSVWRLASKKQVCAKCGKDTLIPEDSPMGKQLVEQYGSNSVDTSIPVSPETPLYKKTWFWIILVCCLIIWRSISSFSTTTTQQTSVQNTDKNSKIVQESPFRDISSSKDSGKTKYIALLKNNIPEKDEATVGKYTVDALEQVYGTSWIEEKSPTVEQITLAGVSYASIKTKSGRNFLILPLKTNGMIFGFNFWEE